MTRLVPKPLLEVAGKPFLDYILDEVSRYPTIQNIVLLAGHQAGQVVDRYDGKTLARRGDFGRSPSPLRWGRVGR